MASCGALMLVPFATGMGLLPMVLVTALLVAERVAPGQWPVSSLAERARRRRRVANVPKRVRRRA